LEILRLRVTADPKTISELREVYMKVFGVIPRVYNDQGTSRIYLDIPKDKFLRCLNQLKERS